MKKVLLFLMTMLLAACSAPMPGEDLGESQEPLAACTVNASIGSTEWPPVDYITGVHITAGAGGKKWTVTRCTTDTNTCLDLIVEFADVSWVDAHTLSPDFVADVNYPLRRMVTRAPGCMLSSPTKYCVDFQGDNFVGDHVNPLQNNARFLTDRPIDLVDLTAPAGYGFSRFSGTTSNPNTLVTYYANPTHTAMMRGDLVFTTPGCN